MTKYAKDPQRFRNKTHLVDEIQTTWFPMCCLIFILFFKCRMFLDLWLFQLFGWSRHFLFQDQIIISADPGFRLPQARFFVIQASTKVLNYERLRYSIAGNDR